MAFVLIQFLNGLASASSLFLIASGLSIIFGVTRIVNFAHGSFYMLGAYIAFSFVTWLPRTPLGFWGGIFLGALAVAVLGAVVEIVLLKRIYRSPELFQLLATFGIVLIVADAALKIWGPEELLAPRPQGLRGAVDIMGRAFPQYDGHVDEVIVVDDHITGVLTEHQAGRFLGMNPAGIRVRGRRSTPGRYFQVASPGRGWGGTDIADPLTIIESIDAKAAHPGMRLLMVSTTGEDAEFFILDDELRPEKAPMPDALRKVVERIGENCEPALASVLFMAGAGGSLRAGVTENPVRLTRSVRNALVRVTCGGAPVYVWPGGGITLMVDVTLMPDRSFGYVPTPAIVGPIECTMRLDDYAALGGHMDRVQTLDDVLASPRVKGEPWRASNPWPLSLGDSRQKD